MKRNSILAVLLPVLAAALTFMAVPDPAEAQRGGGGGGRELSRGSSVRSGGDVVTRSSRDVVTRSGGRGSYYGRGGYGTRYYEPRHRHSHFSGSIWIGPSWGIWDPFWYPYYPAYRYYSPPATVVVPQEPQEYIQPESQQGETGGYWYYCRNPEGYYPYVERCPGGWMRVVPDTVPPDEEDDADVQDKEK